MAGRLDAPRSGCRAGAGRWSAGAYSQVPYRTKLMESLPAELKDSLPSTKSIEAELESQDRKRRSVETEHDADLKADCALRKVRRGHS